MYHFGEKSRAKYMEIDGRLQDILDCAIHVMDFSILQGHRNEKDQNKAFKKKRSQLRWPKSKHNQKPSKAVDIGPYDPSIKNVDWDNHNRFIYLAGIIMAIAHTKDIKIRWGADWNSDTFMKDETFLDMAHFELIE